MNKQYAARIKKLSTLLHEEGLLTSSSDEISRRLDSIGYEIDPITKELFGKHRGEMRAEDWREFFKMEQDLIVFGELSDETVTLTLEGMPLTRDFAIQIAKHELCQACGLEGSLSCAGCAQKVSEEAIQILLSSANATTIPAKPKSGAKDPAFAVAFGSMLKDT
jgi:hypothetical protein